MKQSTKELIVSGLVMLMTVCAALIFGVLLGLGIFKAYECFRPVNEQDGTVDESTAEVYKATAPKEAEYYSLEEYEEGQGPVPEWYRPDEEMSAEWEEPEVVTRDAGCPDWNYNSTLWGWNGHCAEAWELDLLARVFYLEFWGTSLPCSEAGCDAILNLWNTGNYGRTLYDALSSYDPKYGYTYRVYPHVWETDYDAEGLAWCKAFCEERFYNGPEWEAVYFQLGGYHDPDWVTPAYEIDHVFFSVPRW